MLIKVKVYPNSKKQEVIQRGSDSFQVKIRQKPKQGLANQAVKSALASYFKTQKAKIRILRGIKRRNKIIEIL